jgi:protein TonB
MNAVNAKEAEPRLEAASTMGCAGVYAIDHDPDRRLAWVNSICTLFVVVGIVGLKPQPVQIKPLPALEDVSVQIVEPLPQPPPTEAGPSSQEESEKVESELPQVVVVTPETPAINFAVPTGGNLVELQKIAKAIPLSALKRVAPLPNRPAVLDNTGNGGERPQPPYPKIALAQGHEGAVVLRMTVDEAGAITAIDVDQSSGFPLLDRSALDFVRRHWIVPPGTGSRMYEVTINYKLQRG